MSLPLHPVLRSCAQFSLLLLSLLSAPVLAQDSATATATAKATDQTSMREVLEVEEKAEQLLEEREQSDPKRVEAGDTPLSSLLGLRDAMRKGDLDKAGEYLDMRYLPEELEEHTPAELAKALIFVWGQQNIIDLSSISDAPEGDLNDGLPSYRDQIGTVTISDGEIPIYLQRVPDGHGGKVWKMSNATVAQIPKMWGELGYSPFAIYLSQVLPDIKFMGMSNWQVLATAVFFILAWPVAAIASNLLMRLALLIPNGFPLGIARFFQGPVRFFLYILIARVLTSQMNLSLTARVLLESSGIDYIAYTVLALGLLSLLRDYQIRKMERAGNAQYVALLKPLTTIIKMILVTGIALVWADSAGYNMSTILAGLGVGSLAVALAAQKTLENMIGALTLYAARPIKPGDFCRFGKVVGVVEEIGLRSTVLRTLNRTQVVIPNSVFSSGDVENYSVRDRIRYFHTLRLQLCDAEQLRVILARVRELFYAHPQLLQETVSVRLQSIEEATVLLRLDAGVPTTDYQEYLAVAEDLNLRLIEIVHQAGAHFSGPGQTLQLQDPPSGTAEALAAAEQTVTGWREGDELPFPNYSSEQIAALKGTLDYPPAGSAR